MAKKEDIRRLEQILHSVQEAVDGAAEAAVKSAAAVTSRIGAVAPKEDQKPKKWSKMRRRSRRRWKRTSGGGKVRLTGSTFKEGPLMKT